MSSKLEDCPSELIELIVTFLDLSDICNLRLTGRNIATKATQDYFKSFFLSKHVEMTPCALQEFVFVTMFDRLGTLVQHLILVGVVYDTTFLKFAVNMQKLTNGKKRSKLECDLRTLKQRHDDDQQLHKSGRSISLLSEALCNIHARARRRSLRSLNLEVVVYQEDDHRRSIPLAVDDWKVIWQCTASTFHTTILALTASGLPIKNFNIFNNPQLQSCSLASNELDSIDFENKGLIVSLSGLKSLSLSLSNRELLSLNATDVRTAATHEGNFEGFTKLLRLCSQLESLKLHQYFLDHSIVQEGEFYHGRLLQRATEMNVAPLTMRRLELRGFYVTQADLLGFIKETAVRYLSMHDIHLPLGSFKSIFDYCTSIDTNMESLYFNSLTEKNSAVAFYEPGVLGNRYVLERAGIEIRRPIEYEYKLQSEDWPSWNANRGRRAMAYGPYWEAKFHNKKLGLS